MNHAAIVGNEQLHAALTMAKLMYEPLPQLKRNTNAPSPRSAMASPEKRQV